MCQYLLLSLLFVLVSSNLVLANFITSPPTTTTTRDYVNFKSTQARDLLRDIYAQSNPDDADAAGKWKNLWSRRASDSRRRPRAINLSDETLIVDEARQRVLSVAKLNLAAANNDARDADQRQLNLASASQPIEFIKSYFRNGLSLFVVCQMSYCTHYDAAAATFGNRQLIEYPGFRAIDAAYFTHARRPHLVVGYDRSAKVYRWNGKQMDYVDEIFVAAPKSIVTFDSGPSTIILFTIEGNADARPNCVIYEFNDESSLHQMRSAFVDAAMSIYPYSYAGQQFFLTINQMGLAEILSWNGTAFEKLTNLPDIHPFDQIRVAQIENETFVFTSDSHALHVYKIQDKKLVILNDLLLLNNQRIVEITAWKYENTIMLLLVKMNPNGTFQTELWQMSLYVEESDNEKYEKVWACFRELKGALDARAAAIKSFEIAQSGDLSSLNNSGKTLPLHLADLIINDGNISVVEFRNGDHVASPQHVKERLLELKQNTSVLADNLNKNTATLLRNVSIVGDAYFDELFIDNLEVDYVNGGRADFENYLISGMDQQFSVALNVKKVYIDDLSVSSLCGYGSDHWMQVNDSVRSDFAALKNANSSIVNDTIVIESELLIMTELNAKKINGIEFNGDFLENVFIIGQRQAIRGEVRYDGIVQATRLYSGSVNNVSSADLITKSSNQSLRDVFIDTLQVEQLRVEKINGVPVDKAARMSRENVIRGKVTLSNLIITDELTVNENIAIPLTHSSQVYDRIYIDGDVFVKNLDFDEHTSVTVSGLLHEGIRSLVASSWTKSSDQVIPSPISLDEGASIDQLDCAYLNGLGERDFLYTDSAELSDLENVTFGNFQFNNVVGESSPNAASFVEESHDYVTFRKSIRMRYLSVDKVVTDKYNGIPIESIMQSNDLLEFPDDFAFETVRVDGEMRVGELRVNRLNGKSSERLEKALRINQNLAVDSLSAGDVTLASVNVSRLNGHDLSKALSAQESLLNRTNNSATSLVIDGEVTIEGSLHVDSINNEEASDYVSRLKSADPSDLIQIASRANLTIVENFDVTTLNGQKISDFFAAALSRSQRQTLGERVTLADAHIDYLTADAINSVDLMKLMYADQPAVLYANNVAFSNLYVDGRVTSQTINWESTSKLKRTLHRIPITSLDSLLVQGDVEWEKPSGDFDSLACLLDKAVTKHEHQFVDSLITFERPVVVETLYVNENEIEQKMSEIISDATVDRSNAITVRGTKTFRDGLVVGSLEVDGNIDIERVNGLDIREISSQVFQKNKPEVMSANVTFLDEVEIGRLVTNKDIHGVALQQLAVVGQQMPKKLNFQHLVVDGDVSLYKLDGVDFDDFMKRRVTTDGDNEIFADVEFVHSVRVLNGTFVASINEIIPENLVLNNADGTPIMVHGSKIFNSKVTVEQNLETPIINNFKVDSIYDNAILNGTNADIFGNLVFEGDVEMLGNITISGEINGLPAQRFTEIKHLQNRLAINTLSKGLSLLKDSLSETETKAFDATVLYLEEEKKLNWHFARAQSMKNPPVKNKTRLEIIATETYGLCALQNGCSCRKQYIVDVSPSGKYEIQEQNTNNVTYTLYPSEGTYGLKIISKSTSYSEQCSRTIDAPENSKIFWFKYSQNREILRRTPAVVIDDYISDAQIFQVEDQLCLIVATFYSKETKSHATNSLVYQFDMKNGKTVLAQTIPTNGAKNIEIFRIPNVGVHALIGCVKGKAESLLLRFNPITRQFQMVRSFATGGSKHVASVSSYEESFVILNNPDIRGLQIFVYDENYDNFVDYQNILFESRVTSLEVFYAGDFGHSDAFVVTTTKDGWLYIYEYMFYGKFQLKMSYWADDIQVVTPFRHMNENYLFAGFKFNSTVYKVIQQGYY